jgi:hypothetical protein
MTKEMHAMNMDERYPLTNLFNDDARFVVRSDADEQLIVHVPFIEPVNISGVSIVTPDGETAPTEVQIYANNTTLDFDDAGEVPATAKFALGAAERTGEQLKLEFVKFQRVHHLAFFFDNHQEDAEVTEVASIKIFGESTDGLNMADWGKKEEEG